MAAWLESGMYIDSMLIFPVEGKAVEEGIMLRRDGGCRIMLGILGDAITFQGFLTADMEEEILIALPGQIVKKHKVVITHERDHASVLFLKRDYNVDHFLGLRSPVNIIAKKNDCVHIAFDFGKQVFKRSGTAVDITDN